MKLIFLIFFFGTLSVISATALNPKIRSSHRLKWLKNLKIHELVVDSISSASTPRPSTTGYPWNYPTSSTGYPWNYPTSTTAYPWNYPSSSTSRYTWNYPPSTTGYPWNYPTSSTGYPWNYPSSSTSRYTWNYQTTTHSPTGGPPTCPDGTIQSMSKEQCFQIFTQNLTFIEAEMACRNKGGNLASLHNAFDNMLLNDYARNMLGSNVQYYIGGNDLDNQGSWKWTDKTLFDFQDWVYYGNSGDYLDCAQVVTTHGAWQKVDCYSRASYACTVAPYIH